MTFVSSAFLFDPEEETRDDFLVELWASLVGAMLTNLLLLPVQHFLPYMVSNVNSISSFTPTPVPLLKREMRRVSCWKPSPRQRTEKEIMARALTQWVGLTLPPSSSVAKNASEALSSVSTELHFFCCRVKMPSRNQQTLNDRKLPALEPHETTRLVTFQRRVRQTMRECRSTRSFEFRAWYKGHRADRHVLAVLSVAVMAVVTAFTLWICFLLAGTFNESESLLWMDDVGRSFALQVFLTDPAITLLVIFAKLLVSSALLRRGKKRRKRELVKQREHVEASMSTASRKLNTAVGRARALKFVLDTGRANTSAIEDKIAQNTAAKEQCEIDLKSILAAKQRLQSARRAIARPSAPELKEWDLQQVDLDQREFRTRNALAALEALLAVLRSTDGASEEELRQAEEMVLKLQRRLGKMARTKGDIEAKEVLLKDEPVESIKRRRVEPLVALEEEPEAERFSIHHSSSARRPTPQTPVLNVTRSRSRIIPVVRRGARRTRKKRTAGPTSMSDSSRVATSSSGLVPRIKPRGRRGQRDVTWTEVRQLQALLKMKAAKQAAAKARRINRRPGRLSPAAINVILQRRTRRRQMLAEQRARQSALVVGSEGHNL